MDITITQPDAPLPTQFAHSLSMVIRSFKGRRDVEVHLFRGHWDNSMEKELDWTDLINNPDGHEQSDDTSRNVILESFSSEERDRIINYLKDQYSTRLTAIRSTPLSFPIPAGLAALSQLNPGKNVGVIEFNKIPSYSLDIPLKGLYDLNQHPPIVEE